MAPPEAAATASYLEALRQVAERIFPTLDGRSYYQLLNVPETSDVRTLRAAFFKLAAQLHPDRFHTIPDAALKDRLETIYARLGEAYRVLSNPERRAAYDRGLAAGQRRLDMSAREVTGPRNPEDVLTHPEAKKFFRLGMACLGRKDWKGAVLNLTFARNMEPTSQLLNERLAEATAGAKAQAKPAAPPGR
jgi:curved DNA-binding protein CbpA